MKRKAKAFWIGFLAPVITLWVLAFFASGYNWALGYFWMALFLTVPAILVGGLPGMIASVCTSGAPMSRKAKAGLIGFYSPVILACGIVMVVFFAEDFRSDCDWQGLATMMAALFVGGPSILLGLLIALVAAKRTQNKPGPLECGKCGYSLVGLTSDKCPECGCEVCAGAKP